MLYAGQKAEPKPWTPQAALLAQRELIAQLEAWRDTCLSRAVDATEKNTAYYRSKAEDCERYMSLCRYVAGQLEKAVEKRAGK